MPATAPWLPNPLDALQSPSPSPPPWLCGEQCTIVYLSVYCIFSEDADKLGYCESERGEFYPAEGRSIRLKTTLLMHTTVYCSLDYTNNIERRRVEPCILLIMAHTISHLHLK